MSQLTPPPITLDSLLPPEMAKKAENIGVSKANLGPFRMMALAVLAGAFIALGAVFMTTVTAGASGVLAYGIARLVGGFAFCLGLIPVCLLYTSRASTDYADCADSRTGICVICEICG